ncbi:MAG: hypothetical protein GX817_02415, partial [Elusimicrobia bacterium]|nr:hypothetical protein [Elusimicrobiota bacterium]
PGFAGSDIANVMNESALLAGREDAKGVTMHHAEEAIDRIIAGPAKKSRVISDEEKRKIAYHEAGHTLVALHLKNADPVHKVSILQRGPALGYTLQLPMEDRYLTSEDEILDKLSVMLGGRSAEEIIFNEKTTGAHDDLRRVTEMAYKLVVEYGMSEELGPLTYNRDRENIFLGREISQGREYSEETARRIDKGVRNIVERCHKVALDVLETNKDKLIELAEELIKREQIVGDEIKIIAGIMPPPEKTELAPEVESESKETRDSEPDLFDIEETSEADEASLGEKDKLKQEKDAGDDKTLTSAKTSPKQERDAGDDKDLASVKTSSKQERDAGDNKALSSAKASSKQEKDSGDDRSLAVEENSSKKEKTAKNDKSTVRGKAVPKKEKNVGDGDSAILKKDISKAEKDSGNDESLAGLEKTPKKGEKASSDKSSPKSSSSKNPSLEKENLVEAEEDKKGKDGS